MNLNANIVAVNGALGKGAVDMVGMFNNMSMLAIAIIGFALSLLYYKNNQRPVAAAGAAEGDDDDESNEKLANGTTGYKITKDDLAQINRRNLFGFQDGWNYERMQHSGYLWIILPTLRKLYGDGTPELKEACRASAHRSSTPQTSSTRSSPVSIWRSRKRRALRASRLLPVSRLVSWDRWLPSAIPSSVRCSRPFSALWLQYGHERQPLGYLHLGRVNILVDWFRCKQTTWPMSRV